MLDTGNNLTGPLSLHTAIPPPVQGSAVKRTASRPWRSRGGIGNGLVGTALGGDKNTQETSREGKRILGNSVYSDEDDLSQVTEYLRGTENSPVRIWVRVGRTGRYQGAAASA